MSIRYLALAALLCGCGSDDSGRVSAFISKTAQASCDWEFRCCTDAEITQLDGKKFAPGDAPGCVPYRSLQLATQLYVDRLAVSEGRMRIDDARAQACVTQLEAKACNVKPGMPAPAVDPMAMDACADVFIGNTGAGAECIYANECVKGAHCVTDALAVGRGVCVPYQQDGQICNDSTDCDPKVTGLYCAKADYHCHVRAPIGQPCMYTTDSTGMNPRLPMLIECDNGNGKAYCAPDTKLCTALPGDGMPCLNPIPPGIVNRCDPDPALQLTCVGGGPGTTGGTCRAPAGVGQDCTLVNCAKDLYCTQAGRTCAMLPGFGQDCSMSGYRCQAGFSCLYNSLNRTYMCDQPASVGEDCTMRQCDIGLYCSTLAARVCRAQLPDGAPCTSSDMCLSAYCNGTTCMSLGGQMTCTGR